MQLLSSSSLKLIKLAVSLTEEELISLIRAVASQIVVHALSILGVVPLLKSRAPDLRLKETSLVEQQELLPFYSRYSESCFEH